MLNIELFDIIFKKIDSASNGQISATAFIKLLSSKGYNISVSSTLEYSGPNKEKVIKDYIDLTFTNAFINTKILIVCSSNQENEIKTICAFNGLSEINPRNLLLNMYSIIC